MTDSRVYFVKSARSNALKIGVAGDPRKRLSGMQTGSVARLTLIAELPGDERYERVLHEHFAEYRIRGEWFRCEGRLAAFVSLLPAIYATDKKAPRRRTERSQKIDATPDPNVDKYFHKFVEPLLRNAVIEYGVAEFAALVGSKRGRVARAINGRGYHFPLDWVPWVLLRAPNAREIASAIVAPFNLRIATAQEIGEELAALDRLNAMRANVLRILGPEDGAKLLASFEEECAQVVRERQADFAREQPLLHAIIERNRPVPESP